MSLVDGNLSKLSALCTRLQKLCTTHPVLAPTAVDKLADLLLSLQDQIKKPTKGRSISASRTSINSQTLEPITSGRESKASSVSFKDENHNRIRNVVSTKPRDERSLRNSSREYEDLKSSEGSNPDYETLQKEYESMTVKVKDPIYPNNNNNNNNNVEVFDYEQSLPPTPHIVSTSSYPPIDSNKSRQEATTTHFQNEREQQFKKKLELRKGLDDQIAEKKAKEIHDALREGTPLAKIRGYRTFIDTPSSTFPPTPIETPSSRADSRVDTPLTLSNSPSSSNLSTSGSPPSTASNANAANSSPQFSRFKYNQATPEQQEALLQKFQKQQEFKKMLQDQMDEKQKIRTRAISSSSSSMHSTW